MSQRSRITIAAMVALCALRATSATAQIVAPPIDRHGFELGYAYKWFDRDVESPPISGIQWEVATFYGRYGAFDRVTFSAEGGVSDIEHEDFSSIYRRYTMGGGMAVSVYERSAWEFAVSAHYQTVWDNDVSSWDFDKRTAGINVDALAAWRTSPFGQYLRVWAGPTYVDDTAENYLWGMTDPVTHEPTTNWGAVAGAEMLLWDHVSGLAYAIFLENPQWRLGLAWRMGGEP